jgi:hypothetical protein
MIPEIDQGNFRKLNVGHDTRFVGDVNVDYSPRGYGHPQTIEPVQGTVETLEKEQETGSFLSADPEHLPIKDDAFDLVFSSHKIQQAQNPLTMLREMCRVTRRKVIVRYTHRKSTTARLQHGLSYFDEDWFNKACKTLGFRNSQFALSYESSISSRRETIIPQKLQATPPGRTFKRLQESQLLKRFQVPSEMELWIKKRQDHRNTSDVKFVVVYNRPQIFKDCFASSAYIQPDSVIAYHNLDNESLPKLYNQTVHEHLNRDVWFVFCHQDLILDENLTNRLRGKDSGAIYGPIGARVAMDKLVGLIIQRDGTSIGSRLTKDTPVQTLDEMCLIAHSEVFRQGLAFDENFRFHFYGSDLCMQAYRLGFDVLATQINCQHKSRTLTGDISSPEYLASLKLFREKWKQFLPVMTTTKVITQKNSPKIGKS